MALIDHDDFRSKPSASIAGSQCGTGCNDHTIREVLIGPVLCFFLINLMITMKCNSCCILFVDRFPTAHDHDAVVPSQHAQHAHYKSLAKPCGTYH